MAISNSNITNETDIFNTALILSVTSCSLSVLGGILILATFLAIPEIRNFTRKLMVCLTVADLLTASGYFVSVIRNFNENDRRDNETDTLCTVQGTLTTFSSLASFFLTSVIAMYIFDTVINQYDRIGMNAWLLVFNMISWGIPAWLTSLAVENKAIGTDASNITGPWCWVKGKDFKADVFWMIIAGKGWEIACYLITTSLYILLKIHLFLRHRKKKFSQIHTSLRDEDYNFLYVWFVLYVIRVWGTIRCILYLTMQPSPSETFMKVLLYLQAVGDPLQAFCNSILFCICDKTVRRKIWCCICHTNSAESEYLLGGEIDNVSQNS